VFHVQFAKSISLPAGIRQVELDAYPDPQGGLFSTSAGRKLAGENGFLQIPALSRPGWKVS
jgi:Phosphoinositide phospholipase C, Ca2+-dependent